MDIEFEIPKHWKTVTFEDVAEGKNAIVDGPFGSNLKTSDYIDDNVNGVPVLTTKNLEGDYSDGKVRFISKEKFESLKRSQVNPGDILVAKIGSIGKTGIYPKNARTAIIPANLLKFTVSRNVSFNYVFYYLNSRGLQNRIKKIATATAQPAFNVTKFRKLRIPLPPLSEQEVIVAKIEELLSELDNGKQQLQTALQQLKVYRQSLLKWAFEGKLTHSNVKEGELPEGWKWVKLGCLATKITDGEHITPRRTIEGFLLLSARNIQNGYLALENVDYVPEDEYTRIIKRCNPESGDILISCSGSIGRVCRVPKDLKFVMVRSVALVKLDWKNNSSKFYEYMFQSPLLQRHIEKSKKATAQANLFLGPIKNLDVIACSLEQQQLIVDELESKLTICDNVEETIKQSLQQAETLRQSILKKAFEGKLV